MLNDCIDTWYREHDIDKSVLMELKGKVIDKVDEKIKTFSNNASSKFYNSVLQQNKSLNILNFL